MQNSNEVSLAKYRRRFARVQRRLHQWGLRPTMMTVILKDTELAPSTNQIDKTLQELVALFPQISRLLRRLDDRYQWLFQNSVDRLFGEAYQRSLKEMSGHTNSIDMIPAVVKQRNREIGASFASLALASVGIGSFIILAAVINAYLSLVLIQIGLRDMREQGRFTARGKWGIINVTLIAGGLINPGLYLLQLQSVMNIMGILIDKFIETVYGQSSEQLVDVFGQLPQTVSIIRAGEPVVCPISEVQAGDTVVVEAGQVVPVDGRIVFGHASIDQHALTGEAQPAEKGSGDTVLASTLILMGTIHIEVEQSNATTLAAQITEILNNTSSEHTTMALRGVKIADDLAIASILAGLVALPLQGVTSMIALWGVPIGNALLATSPVSLMNYLGFAASSGILIKDGRSLEQLSKIDTIVFDKTGTLTLDQPTVYAVHSFGEATRSRILMFAATLEQRQTHPIAAAIREAAATENLTLVEVDETRVELGYGLTGLIDGKQVMLGSQRLMEIQSIAIEPHISALAEERQAIGHSIVYLAVDDVLCGMIELAPTMRPESRLVIEAIHANGMQTYMITGDHEQPAQALANTLGIDHVFANVLPAQKAELVEMLQAEGRSVMFVGDGINDSIALRKAQISVSIRGATTVATDTAQIILMDGTIQHLPALFEVARQYERDLRLLYTLAVPLPLMFVGGILVFGWGVILEIIFSSTMLALGFAVGLRPTWARKHLDAQLEAHTASVQLIPTDTTMRSTD